MLARGSHRAQRMTRTPFDHFAKAQLLAHEGARGRAETEFELPGESVFVDLAWTPSRRPSRAAPRDVLDRMASRLSLWEFFRKPPTVSGLLGCVHKLHAWHAQRMRTASSRPRARPALPTLWIVSAGVPRSVLRAEVFAPMQGWPEGFFSGSPCGHTGLVIVSRVPHGRETLLLRLMGAGATLMRAVDDLAALPADSHERMIALPQLHHLRIASPEDLPMKAYDKFMQTTQKLIDEHEQASKEKARNEGLQRGLERGLAQGLALLVRLASRKLGRALTDDERRTLTARLDTLGPERLGDAVLDLSADELDRWISDPAAR